MKDKYDTSTQESPFPSEGDLLLKHCTRSVKGKMVDYTCNKGLWGVSGHIDNESRIRKEAEHYFIQYYIDGEYDD